MDLSMHDKMIYTQKTQKIKLENIRLLRFISAYYFDVTSLNKQNHNLALLKCFN